MQEFEIKLQFESSFKLCSQGRDRGRWNLQMLLQFGSPFKLFLWKNIDRSRWNFRMSWCKMPGVNPPGWPLIST